MLKDSDGSVLLARLLCDALGELDDPREVNVVRATAFAGVQEKDEELGRILQRLRSTDSKYLRRSMEFARRLQDTMERENKIVPKKGGRPDEARFRPALAIKRGKEAHLLFTTIFNTAYAMLSDVPIELTADAAA